MRTEGRANVARSSHSLGAPSHLPARTASLTPKESMGVLDWILDSIAAAAAWCARSALIVFWTDDLHHQATATYLHAHLRADRKARLIEPPPLQAQERHRRARRIWRGSPRTGFRVAAANSQVTGVHFGRLPANLCQ